MKKIITILALFIFFNGFTQIGDEQLLNKNNITNNSKITLNKFLQMYQNYPLTINEEFWYMQSIPKIKTLTMSFIEEEKDRIYKRLQFNSSGQVTSEIKYSSKGNKSSERKYIYENDMLTMIILLEGYYGEITTINYDDNKMILSGEFAMRRNKTELIFFVENDMLLSKSSKGGNLITENKITGNCIIEQLNGDIQKKNCSSPYGTFPYIYTSYKKETKISPELIAELLLFLKQNPSLKTELEEDEEISYPLLEIAEFLEQNPSLKTELEEYEEINYHLLEIAEFLEQNPSLKTELKEYEEVMRITRNYRVEKKGDNIFEKYHPDVEKPNDEDNYKIYKTFYLNEKNLISKIESKRSVLKIEYTYYP